MFSNQDEWEKFAMTTQDPIETNTQDHSIRTAIFVLAGIFICCLAAVCLYVLIIGLSFPFLRDRARRTPTPISLVEVNSTSPLGKFTFGHGDVDDFCHVKTQIDTFSQEDLLRDSRIDFSAQFASEYEGKHLSWDVYDEKGNVVELKKVSDTYTLSSEMKNCFDVLFRMSPRSKPGKYILEVKYEEQLAFREVFTITYSDLTKIPRPNREPFGNFSFGRRVLADETSCETRGQVPSYPIKTLTDDPWFYVASPYQISDIGKKFYLTVRDAQGELLFDHEEREIDDDINLCVWMGFSMAEDPAGKYDVIIEDEHSKVIYETTFELK